MCKSHDQIFNSCQERTEQSQVPFPWRQHDRLSSYSHSEYISPNLRQIDCGGLKCTEQESWRWLCRVPYVSRMGLWWFQEEECFPLVQVNPYAASVDLMVRVGNLTREPGQLGNFGKVWSAGTTLQAWDILPIMYTRGLSRKHDIPLQSRASLIVT